MKARLGLGASLQSVSFDRVGELLLAVARKPQCLLVKVSVDCLLVPTTWQLCCPKASKQLERL